MSLTPRVYPPDTTVIRLPGMTSRIFVKKVILIHEVPDDPDDTFNIKQENLRMLEPMSSGSRTSHPSDNGCGHRPHDLSTGEQFNAYPSNFLPSQPMDTYTLSEPLQSYSAPEPPAEPPIDPVSPPDFLPLLPAISLPDRPSVPYFEGSFHFSLDARQAENRSDASSSLLAILNGALPDIPSTLSPTSLYPLDRISSTDDPPIHRPPPIGARTSPRPMPYQYDMYSAPADPAPPWPPILLNSGLVG